MTPQISRIATEGLQEHSSEFRCFRLTPKFPDMNIIEYIWDALQRAVQKRYPLHLTLFMGSPARFLFKDDPDFVINLLNLSVEDRQAKAERQLQETNSQLELEKIKLQQIEREIELQKALAEGQATQQSSKGDTINLENLIKSEGAKLELHTDACKLGLGAVLLQQGEDGRFYPIHYMSKKTSIQEEKLCSYELEVLAVIEALKNFEITYWEGDSEFKRIVQHLRKPSTRRN
ncbi:retrovirus-related Pol polyprotein from transposon 17.6 [Trichonephila clavipes]|nr:retrovirus-related Pol polyprotein from transposon 17.6 [Trichonephila clavipes]